MLSEKQLERLAATFRAAEVPEDKIAEEIARVRHRDGCIDRRECPDCGGKLTRRLDPRQAGMCELAGTWYNYHCPACGCRADRKEEPN